jgi:magnesium transporter
MGSEGMKGEEAQGGQRIACFTDLHEAEIVEHLREDRFFWLDLQDPSERQLQRLGELLKLHPLTIEDAEHQRQRPKLEEYDGYVFLVFYAAGPEAPPERLSLREVQALISGGYLVTLHQGPIPELEQLRKRYEAHDVRSERFLVYRMLDAIVAGYFPALARIDDEIDEIEEAILKDAGEECLRRINTLKRDLVNLRRIVSPQRDVFARDVEAIAELPGLEDDVHVYFRDIYDGLVRVSDLVDSYRDLLSGATDMYLSMISNRQGEVNKQLTMIATIFLPLTFLTGFFGQNFAYLTGHILDTELSFLLLGLGTLVIAVFGFAFFFRRRGWY